MVTGFPSRSAVVGLSALAGLLIAPLLIIGIILSDARPFATPDSSAYLAMSDSIRKGEGFKSYTTTWDMSTTTQPGPQTHWPPGFPVLLAGLDVLGLDPMGLALWVCNLLLLVLTLVVTGTLVLWLTGQKFLAQFAVVTMVASTGFMHRYFVALSEPLFVALIVSAIAAFLVYLHSAHTHVRTWSFLVAGLLLGFAWLTRYAALGVIPTVIALVFINKVRVFGCRFLDTAIFCCLSCGPAGVWFVHNMLQSGEMVDSPSATNESFSDNLSALTSAFADLVNAPGPAVGIAVLWTASLLLILKTRSKRLDQTHLHVALPEWLTTPTGALASISMLYIAFIFVTGTLTGIVIDARKLTPVFPLLVVLTMQAAEIILAHTNQIENPMRSVTKLLVVASTLMIASFALTLFGMLLGAVLLLVVVLPTLWITRRIPALTNQPLINKLMLPTMFLLLITSYILVVQTANVVLDLRATHDEHQIFTWIEQHPPDTVFYTNDAPNIYMHTHAERIKVLPRGDTVDSSEASDSTLLDELANCVGQADGYVVMLDYTERDYLISEADLIASGHFELVGQFSTARVYSARAYEP